MESACFRNRGFWLLTKHSRKVSWILPHSQTLWPLPRPHCAFPGSLYQPPVHQPVLHILFSLKLCDHTAPLYQDRGWLPSRQDNGQLKSGRPNWKTAAWVFSTNRVTLTSHSPFLGCSFLVKDLQTCVCMCMHTHERLTGLNQECQICAAISVTADITSQWWHTSLLN